MAHNIQEYLLQFRQDVDNELQSILEWWMKNMPAPDDDGFHGGISNHMEPLTDAPRGLVLNSRILWTFSAAYMHQPDPRYLVMAERAFHYLLRHFDDREYGGMYWSVDKTGAPLEDKKQVYGIAFCIYGLSEYYRAAHDAVALEKAKELFALLEQHSYDPVYGGYTEACSRDWQPLEDIRLSDKDANEKKSMNTHLHVLEAYSNLFSVWKHPELQEAIIKLLIVFRDRIIDHRHHRQLLFFSETWESRSPVVSFGHDIEAAWLLHEAAVTAGDAGLLTYYKENAVLMAGGALQGIDTDGGLWYEYDRTDNNYNYEKHWWPQAEAMVGFFNAWQVSGNEAWLWCSRQSWDFIQRYIRDQANGEWFWGIDEKGQPMEKEKAGFWKCPYHNGRACIEISKRISNLLS
jgi:mannobiose 2-epimerase